MTKPKKGRPEGFARFFEEPTREALRDLIKASGELDTFEFKRDYPENSKLAKHVLAIANSEGGCVVSGVEEGKEGLNPCGASKFLDKATIGNGLKGYVAETLLEEIEIVDFRYAESEYPALKGKSFQVIFIPDLPTKIPFVSLKTGESVREGAIYARSHTASQEANYTQVQKIINRRIATGHSSEREITLDDHLRDLKSLFTQISKYHSFFDPQVSLVGSLGRLNPKYPAEDYEIFISKLIEKKKRVISRMVDDQ